jgi:hypothetical protein
MKIQFLVSESFLMYQSFYDTTKTNHRHFNVAVEDLQVNSSVNENGKITMG